MSLVEYPNTDIDFETAFPDIAADISDLNSTRHNDRLSYEKLQASISKQIPNSRINHAKCAKITFKERNKRIRRIELLLPYIFFTIGYFLMLSCEPWDCSSHI